jgi:hypothetical protein
MLTSTRRAISYPNPDRSDRADIATHIGYLLAALDLDVVFNQGTDAARIAASHQSGGGRFWWTTDTLILWYDDGTTWRSVGSIPAGTITNSMVASGAAIAYSKLNLSGSIVDSDVASGAAIALSKLAAMAISGQAGSYTAALSDQDNMVTINSASAANFTIPPNSSVSFRVGTVINVAQLGAGQVTIVPGSGVTVNGTPGLKIYAQYGVAAVIKLGTDTWLASGNLSA